MKAVERLLLKLTRIYVPPYIRVNEFGHVEHVDGYWRELHALGGLTEEERRSIGAAFPGITFDELMQHPPGPDEMAKGMDTPVIESPSLGDLLRDLERSSPPKRDDQLAGEENARLLGEAPKKMILPWGRSIDIWPGDEVYQLPKDRGWRVAVRRPKGDTNDEGNPFPIWEIFVAENREGSGVYYPDDALWQSWEGLLPEATEVDPETGRETKITREGDHVLERLPTDHTVLSTPYGDVEVDADDEVFLDLNWDPPGKKTWADRLMRPDEQPRVRLIVRKADGTFIQRTLQKNGRWRKFTVGEDSRSAWRFRMDYEAYQTRLRSEAETGKAWRPFGWRGPGDPEFTDFFEGAYFATKPTGPEPKRSDSEASALWWAQRVMAQAGLRKQTIEQMRLGQAKRAGGWRDAMESQNPWEANEGQMMTTVADRLERMLGWPSQWNGEINSLEDYKPNYDQNFAENNPRIAGMAMTKGGIYVRGGYRDEMQHEANMRNWAADLYTHELVHQMSVMGERGGTLDSGNQSYEEGVTEGFMRTHIERFVPEGLFNRTAEEWRFDSMRKMRERTTSYSPQVVALNKIARLLGFTTWRQEPGPPGPGSSFNLVSGEWSAPKPTDDEWGGLGQFYEWLLRIPQAYRRQALWIMAWEMLRSGEGGKFDTPEWEDFKDCIATLDSGVGLLS